MRKTKIIATVGPATQGVAQLRRLIGAGCNIVRINMSHASQEGAAAVIADVRAISERVGILIDTRGPEVRTTEVAEPFRLERGARVGLTGSPGLTTPEVIRVSYRGISRVLDEGTVVLLADGQIELKILEVQPHCLRCEVLRGGRLSSKKGVNVPGVQLPMPFLSEQDMSDISFACAQGVDFIAASFVGTAEDVSTIRRLIQREGGHQAIVAKVESRYAVENLDQIIEAADGVMVARGDLGVEIPPEEVPVVQKQIIDACRGAGKPVIVATEMLESMIHNPRPTRAETSDVAHAIFEGTDAVMLSGETSVGKFPIEAVATMVRIAHIAETEVARRQRALRGGARANEISDLICKGAWLAAKELSICAILVPTSSGRTARRMSRYRPIVPILATTPDAVVVRKLALSYGIFALPTEHYGQVEGMIRHSCQAMVEAGILQTDDLIAVVAGVPVGRTGTTNLLTIQPVDALIADPL